MEKERYNHFKASDFVLDDDFVNWIRHKNPELDTRWNTWLIQHPEQRVEVEKARHLLMSMSFRTEEIDMNVVQQQWEVVKEKIADLEPESASEEEDIPIRYFPGWLRVAAAALVLLSGLWIGKNYLPFFHPSSTLLTQKEAPNGQQVTVTLTDGTVIQLNAGSTLSYPEKFEKDRREVRLKGEAYFEVAPNAHAPFFIYTEDIRVKVIGTKFTVKAYPENQEVKVAVVEGKVAVNSNQKEDTESTETNEVFLTRNEMATLEKQNKALKVSSFDQTDMLGWKDGILYFEKASFPQIVNQLEKWYGVEVTVQQGVKVDSTWRFSGKFEKKSIDYILDVCRYPERFSYEVLDNKVVIK
ncbi:FecR family protein [Arundinibacter roseus]|uniref:FecR family protein n=1 Tax=Arundinibacter roseus TaxID=2070510 RepID=A0A4R4KBW1_9BACT|nr:FecR family protein [Arundinibacter roseus]TDB65330.1 FecR family protein [Arundinibacter roseus]